MVDGTRMLQRRATESVWTTSGYVLSAGELGVTTDTGIIKIGNGTSTWSELDPAFDSQYLPILGKAADSELLDGISHDGFLKVADAEVVPTADKIARRTTGGRLKVGTATETDDATTLDQMGDAIDAAVNGPVATSIAAAIVSGRQEPHRRTVTHAATAVTLTTTDVGGIVLVANSTVTAQRMVTVPANATAPIPVGSYIDVCSTDAGGLILTPAGSAVLRGERNIFPGYATSRLLKIATDEWLIMAISNPKQGRLPKIRVVRSNATGYSASSYIAVPYDSVDTGDTYNPDSEWFTTGSLPTTRRVVVNKEGEYFIVANFISSLNTLTWTRIVKMTGDNAIGLTLAQQATHAVANLSCRVRLTAGESIGVSHLTTGTGGDAGDNNNLNRNDLTITRIGD